MVLFPWEVKRLNHYREVKKLKSHHSKPHVVSPLKKATPLEPQKRQKSTEPKDKPDALTVPALRAYLRNKMQWRKRQAHEKAKRNERGAHEKFKLEERDAHEKFKLEERDADEKATVKEPEVMSSEGVEAGTSDTDSFNSEHDIPSDWPDTLTMATMYAKYRDDDASAEERAEFYIREMRGEDEFLNELYRGYAFLGA